MLELKNITKDYKTAGNTVKALKGISISFRKSEFVSILGQSGCGKTTLLNIIGGLDHYTTGDLIINGKSTKKFKDRDWDAYRNYSIGFVFQTYNLIPHQTVLSNVELALTISGVSKKERREKAIDALKQVGLEEHINKKPNQLSGGQMQRVAIARALVNNPDIILADEPTGALDTKTSVQIMEILKKISKNKLIIMVTHNPELAEKYSSRIIKILDGKITEDSNPVDDNDTIINSSLKKIKRTSMSFWTSFRLSLNNLLTKKGRTILVAFAGSIGIIGIALVQSVSNGFQAYVDKIQEDTLTSYPMTIMQETTDITSALLAMTTEEKREDADNVKEEQYISKMLASLSTNDLKSFKDYLEKNYKKVEDDLSSVKNVYSVEPLIYSIDKTEKIAKLNPSNLFSSMSGFGTSMMSSYTSTYTQMMEDKKVLNDSYDMLAGKWPEKYDEMVIVLAQKNSIPDLLVYSLGLRDTEELQDVVKKIMSGEKVELNTEPMEMSYEQLMDIDLRLILPTDTYKYNEQYDVYEDMSTDEESLKTLYEKGIRLKIVGVVAPKDGITTTALNPGVSYKKELIDYIINYSKDKEIVKKQLANEDVDVLSGNRFDDNSNNLNMNFTDLISVDTDGLQKAFNIDIDENQMKKQTEGYMTEINNVITTDISPAKNTITSDLKELAKGMFNSIQGEIKEENIESIVDNYLNGSEPSKIFANLEKDYIIPKDVYKTMYSGLLKGLLQVYVTSYPAMSMIQNADMSKFSQVTNNAIPNKMQEYTNEINLSVNEVSIGNTIINQEENKQDKIKIVVNDKVVDQVINIYMETPAIIETINKISQGMTEAVVKMKVMTKVGELTATLTGNIASAFNVDQDVIANSFKMKMTEDEITRIVSSMLNNNKTSAKLNLIKFGYQDKEEPTYIAFYFNSFDGKEHFKKFIEDYNNMVKEKGEMDKEINYTDTTGLLMGSVKTIVNAVTYVLIAFISISLVVSSFMIGIITYISVYERTKEIGILRAIGASKRNISSIFNAETFIIGLLSGIIGIGITYLLIPIINSILHNFTGNIPLNAIFYINNAIGLVVLSVILTLIGGIIPARAASKKDPVIALRTE